MRHPRVRMHPLTLPAIGLLLALLARAGMETLFSLLFAVISHEAGHLLLLALFSVPVYELDITVRGVRIRAELTALSYAREAAVAGAGAAVNLLCGVTLLLFDMPRAAAPSLLLGCYNLLPLTSFDGGRVLASLLCAFTPLSPRAVHTTCRTVSAAALALLYLFCGWAFWTLSRLGTVDAAMLCGAWFYAVFGTVTEQLGQKMNN